MSKIDMESRTTQEESPHYEGWIGDESSGRPEVTPKTDEATSSPVEEEFRGMFHIPAELDS